MTKWESPEQINSRLRAIADDLRRQRETPSAPPAERRRRAKATGEDEPRPPGYVKPKR